MPNTATFVRDRQLAQPSADDRSSASFCRARNSARCVSVAGFPHAVLATGEETAGRYAAVEIIVPQRGPPPHTHTCEDECFYVLQGELEFMMDGQTQRAGAGTLVHAPRYMEHTFRNAGRTPARVLVWITPAGLERCFLEIGDPLPPNAREGVPATPEHIARLLAAAPEYGVRFRTPS